MLFLCAVAAYLVFFALVAYLSEKFSPLLAIGGLLVVMAVAKALS